MKFHSVKCRLYWFFLIFISSFALKPNNFVMMLLPLSLSYHTFVSWAFSCVKILIFVLHFYDIRIHRTIFQTILSAWAKRLNQKGMRVICQRKETSMKIREKKRCETKSAMKFTELLCYQLSCFLFHYFRCCLLFDENVSSLGYTDSFTG